MQLHRFFFLVTKEPRCDAGRLLTHISSLFENVYCFHAKKSRLNSIILSLTEYHCTEQTNKKNGMLATKWYWYFVRFTCARPLCIYLSSFHCYNLRLGINLMYFKSFCYTEKRFSFPIVECISTFGGSNNNNNNTNALCCC